MTKVILNYGNETKTDILPWNILKYDVIYHSMHPPPAWWGGEKGRGEGAGGEVKILEKFSPEIFIVVGSYIVGRVSFCWGMGGGRT